jgi:hypothetical protein
MAQGTDGNGTALNLARNKQKALHPERVNTE